MSYIDVELNINGLGIQARYFREDVDGLFLPLLKTLSNMKMKKQGRLIVFLAAPPGAGKTTLSLFLAQLSETVKDVVKVQSVGMDGFHFSQAYIEKHSVIAGGQSVPMRNVKGSPETYDLQKLTDSIKRLRDNDVHVRWPVYDRKLHDVVQDAVVVDEDIVIIEGNWLLLDEPGWRELWSLCDYSIFVTAEESMLKERLIQRKIAGGLEVEQAAAFYVQSDGVNVVRAVKNRFVSDLELELGADGGYAKRKLQC